MQVIIKAVAASKSTPIGIDELRVFTIGEEPDGMDPLKYFA